jgi:hypothetical protein
MRPVLLFAAVLVGFAATFPSGRALERYEFGSSRMILVHYILWM